MTVCAVQEPEGRAWTRRAAIASLLAAVIAFWIPALASAEEATSLKRSVAVARFSNETRSGQSFLLDDSGDRLGKQAADILSARLASTGRFLLFERLDVDEVSAEQTLTGLQSSGVPVDFLIVGSVSEFGRSTESDTGVFSRAKVQRAYAKVNVRLIEVSTGRIIFASEGEGEATTETKRTFGVGSSAGYDQSLTDRSISAAISQLVSNLVENMTREPWRSFILGEEDDLLIIGGGASQGLREGQELTVYRQGREVVNPQTGAKIRLPGRSVATVKVVDSFGEDEFSEVSFVEVVAGEVGGQHDQYYISDE